MIKSFNVLHSGTEPRTTLSQKERGTKYNVDIFVLKIEKKEKKSMRAKCSLSLIFR